MSRPVRLGLRENAGQFALLVTLNGLVGSMVGLERSVLPLVGEEDFGVASRAAVLAFVVAFGAAKALTNLAAGGLPERAGLVVGALLAGFAADAFGFGPAIAVVAALTAASGAWVAGTSPLRGATQPEGAEAEAPETWMRRGRAQMALTRRSGP